MARKLYDKPAKSMSVAVSTETFAWIRKTAAARGVTVSTLLREVIEAHIKQESHGTTT